MNPWYDSEDVHTTKDVKKVVIVGERRSGKTSLIQKFLSMNDPACDGADCDSPTEYRTHVMIGDNMAVQTTLLDMAPEDPTWLYRDTDAVVVCFSLGSPSSFVRATGHWVPEVRRCLPGVAIVLAGLKKDARPFKRRCVSHLEAFKAAGCLNLERYVECSVFTEEGVFEVFTSAAFAAMTLPELLAYHKLHFGK